MRTALGAKIVDASTIPYGSMDGVSTTPITVGDFLDLDQRPSYTGKDANVYIFNSTIMGPEMHRDLEWPSMFDAFEPATCLKYGHIEDDFGARGPRRCTQGAIQFILGQETSGAPMHMHVGAFNAAIVGRKRWFFVPPAHSFWSRKPVAAWFADEYPHLNPKVPVFECTFECKKKLPLSHRLPIPPVSYAL